MTRNWLWLSNDYGLPSEPVLELNHAVWVLPTPGPPKRSAPELGRRSEAPPHASARTGAYRRSE